MRTRTAALLVGAATVALLAVGCTKDDTGPTTTEGPSGIAVGALLDLTGPGKTLGIASKASLEAAIASAKADGVVVLLDVRDTGSDPDTAAKEIRSLHDKGIHTVIGPQTSSEAKAVLDFADKNDMLVVSQGSTASTLAVANDALYRMVPTDKVEGRATADLVTDGRPGVTLVVAHRDDAGNAGLAQTVTRVATDRGAKGVAGPTYPAEQPDVAKVAADIATAVEGATKPVAVYLAGFEEVAGILAAAAGQTALAEVPFYGGDGSAQSTAVTGDAAAAGFAASSPSGFASPLPTLGDDAAPAPAALTDRLKAAGAQPDALAYGAYDALMVVAKIVVGGGATLEGTALRDQFAKNAEGYAGVSGKISLDRAGDRASEAFAFWVVCNEVPDFNWRQGGTWNPTAGDGPGKVVFAGCPG